MWIPQLSILFIKIKASKLNTYWNWWNTGMSVCSKVFLFINWLIFFCFISCSAILITGYVTGITKPAYPGHTLTVFERGRGILSYNPTLIIKPECFQKTNLFSYLKRQARVTETYSNPSPQWMSIGYPCTYWLISIWYPCWKKVPNIIASLFVYGYSRLWKIPTMSISGAWSACGKRVSKKILPISILAVLKFKQRVVVSCSRILSGSLGK